jgi:hypothetical protein
VSDSLTVVCPNGHENSAGKAFCADCGAPLPTATAPPPDPLTAAPVDSVLPPQTQRPRFGRRALIIAAAAVVLVAVGGFVATRALSHGAKLDLTGYAAAPECGGGYEIENANVEVLNQANEIVGAATTTSDLLAGGGNALCLVSFSVSDVTEADFLKLRIGTHDGPVYQADQLEASGWTVDLTLGDAAIPVSENFCGDADALNTTLLDTATLNKHLFRWKAEIKTEVNALSDDAAYLARNGRIEDAGLIGGAMKSLRPIQGWYGYQVTAAKLNQVLTAVNDAMPELTPPCASRWQHVGYS